MIYIRNLFTQDLRDGKQIAFPTEPSNILFKFSFSNQDPDRRISFKFKEKHNNSPFFQFNGKTINTRIYSAGSESRIDGELKHFLKVDLNAVVDDIVVFRAINITSYEFELIPQGSTFYKGYKALLNGKNHEVVIDQVPIEDMDLIKSNKIREFLFDVFKFLQKEFGDEFLIEKSAIAKRKLAETKYEAYLFPEYFKTHPILGSFDEAQSEESLKTSNTLRYFPENIKILDQKYIYFTTQWGFPEYENSPFFISFNQFTIDYSNKKYKIEYDENSQYYKLVLNQIEKEIPQIDFNLNSFQEKAIESGLIFSSQLVNRFIASLCAKPFVICSGLSGSGKTKLAQAFTKWISADKSQYKIVPVGADWTNREPLLGYPNGLNPMEYITPDSGVLHLLLEASKEQNQRKPYFIILDEMNLSHVERYFADFLSIMESKDTVKLYTGSDRSSTDGLDITQQIGWPKNVFIIGTVNIDETTYMFSPKVLDRANVIEFRITEEEIAAFLNNPGIPDLSKLSKQGANMAENFLAIAAISDTDKNEELTNKLNLFFSELKKVGAEFGYRTASEIMQLVAKLKALEPTIENNVCLDIAIMQKLLPKLHGSRSKLVKVLIALAALCIDDKQKEEFIKNFENHLKNDFDGIEVKFDISFEKLIRMYKNVLANGFTSYAEA